MTIQIAARLKPFCHLPGSTCIIPLTTVQVKAYPTLLRFLDLSTGKSWEEKLDWKGPVQDFTLLLDLEKATVEVFGKTAAGFRRHQITQKIAMKKPELIERLSLGSHTKLDWELVLRRMCMEEMAPALFQLGQLVPHAKAVAPLLNFLQFNDKNEIASQLTSFFKTGFHSILAPRLTDEEFQGIAQEGPVSGSPLALLREGYLALRSLFFVEQDGFSILPNLPPQFHAGRLLNLTTTSGDLISIEWSKKQLKKVIIKPASTRKVQLTIQKFLTTFRINKKIKHLASKPLSLEIGKTLFLDRFEK